MRTSLVLAMVFMFSLMIPLASPETTNSESSQNSNSDTYLINNFDLGVVYDFLDHSRKICEHPDVSQFPERFFIEADGFFYFWTEYYIENENGDDEGGIELWKTNGKPSQTIRVKSFEDSQCSEMIYFKGNIYFSSSESIHGDELWRTNGKTSGTLMFKDIFYGKSGSSPRSFTVFNDELYFTATDEEYGRQLWKTDGTTLGTVRVTNLSWDYFYETEIWRGQISYLTALDTKLVFCIDLGTACLMHSTDGNINQSTMFSPIVDNDILPLYSYPNGLFNNNDDIVERMYSSFAVLDNEIYFTANDWVYGYELWKSDGTVEGTTMVKDIMPKPFIEIKSEDLEVNWYYSYAQNWQIKTLPNGLYFDDENGTIYGTPTQLWDTIQYAFERNSICCSSIEYLNITVVEDLPSDFIDEEGDLTLVNNTYDQRLPLMLPRVPEGLIGNDIGNWFDEDKWEWGSHPFEISSNGEYVFFIACDAFQRTPSDEIFDPYGNGKCSIQSENAYNLSWYISNGTATGTQKISNDLTNHPNQIIRSLDSITIGDYTYGRYDNISVGQEFGVSDGTQNGTSVLVDINPGNESSSVKILGTVENKIIFQAFDGNDFTLWAHEISGINIEKEDLNDENGIDSGGNSSVGNSSVGNSFEKISQNVKQVIPYFAYALSSLLLVFVLNSVRKKARTKRELRESEEVEEEYDNYIKSFYSANRVHSNDDTGHSNDSMPSFDYQGELNEDGWEICEYPEHSGTWWWKDYETETWVLWE